MTVLALNRLWINLLSTGEGISGPSGRGKTQAFSVEGRVGLGANGRRRSITVAGEAGEIPYDYVAVDLATKDKLRTWQGQTVIARDSRGQRWWGTFFGVGVSEYMRTDLYAVSFTIETLTVVEGV